MTRRPFWLFLALVAPIVTLVIVLTRPVYLRADPEAATSWQVVGNLGSGTAIDQAFTPGQDGLSAIDLGIAHDPRARAEIRFELVDDAGRTIRQQVLQTTQLHDLLYSRIRFAPVPSSAGRHFHIDITVLSATGPPIGLVTAVGAADRPVVNVDGMNRSDPLALRAFYGEPVPAFLAAGTLLNRAGQFKPPWLKSPLNAFWILAAGLATGLTLARLALAARLPAAESSAQSSSLR